MSRLAKAMVLLVLITLACNVRGDGYIGVGGNIAIPGVNENPTVPINLSLKYEQDRDYPWFVGLVAYQPYIAYRQVIDTHYVVSIGKRVLEGELSDDFYTYLDLGIALPSEVTAVNSSEVQFYEEAGIGYKNFRLVLSHQSNAGLKGDNEGETSLRVEYRLSF